MNLTAALDVIGAVPVGGAAALCARRLAGPAPRLVLAMIGVEVAVAASAVLLAPASALPVLLVAGWTLGLLAAVDLRAFRLPDIVTAPLGLAGLILGPGLVATRLADHVIGAVAGFGVLAGLMLAYKRLRGRDGLGLGDAKLLAVAGAWLGWPALPTVLVLACAGGLAWAGLLVMRHGRAALAQPIAFGVPLCAAIWICLLLDAVGGAPG